MNRFHYLSPDGKKYHFWDMILSHSNLGLPALKFIEDSGPQQHGVNVRDWRINPRTISLEFWEDSATKCDTRGEILAKLINEIRPNRGKEISDNGWLRFYNDSYIMMEIPVFPLQGPTDSFKYTGNLSYRQVQDTIQFYAFDPIWREVDKQRILVSASDFSDNSCIYNRSQLYWELDDGFFLDDGLFLDTENAQSFACLYSINNEDAQEDTLCLNAYSYIIKRLSVPYGGTWVGDQIDITLTGPMSTPIITNETTNKKIQLNYVIRSNESVIITIRPEFTTVVNSAGQNLIGAISSISDLVDFNLATEGSLTEDGINSITISAISRSRTGDRPNAAIDFSYYTRHISAYGKPECNK
jgi:hypothetical protein